MYIEDIMMVLNVFSVIAVVYLAFLSFKKNRADEKRKMDFEELDRRVKAIDAAIEKLSVEAEKGLKPKEPSEDKKRWTLLNTLNKQTRAANSTIEKLSAETEKGIKCSEELAKGLDGRKAELEGYLGRIDAVLKAMNEALPDTPPGIPPLVRGGEGGAEPETLYREASKLAEEGHNIDEIVERVGLPKGEVQLIVGLKKK